MKPATIHHLNSMLILLSCAIAYVIPFELFLFSYAVLGPLHYLTEIGWLHKKNYFTKGKYDFIFLIAACVVLVYWNYFPPKKSNLMADCILLGVFVSLIFVFIQDWLYRIVLLILAFFSVSFLNNFSGYFTWIAIFLPTIVHVFIFTWAFMLHGALKEKSWQGALSILILMACAVFLFAVQPQNIFYPVSEYVQKSYNTFALLNVNLVHTLNLGDFTELAEIFTTKVGFVVMRFIAFAYTYHYLNWFSKTSVIKWHEVSKTSMALTLTVWIASVTIYAYDYTLGMNVLFFLSFLHVFLEFPLNVVSFAGIGKAVFSLNKKQA